MMCVDLARGQSISGRRKRKYQILPAVHIWSFMFVQAGCAVVSRDGVSFITAATAHRHQYFILFHGNRPSIH